MFSRTSRLTFALPAIVTVAVLVVPVVLDVSIHGARRLFGYTAADSFYYLVVARNAGLNGIIAYDGVHPSNGFHPLWQAMVTLVYAFRLPGHGTHFDLAWMLGVELLLLSLSVWLILRSFRRTDGSVTSLSPLLIPGGFALVVAPVWLHVPNATIAAQNPEEGPLPLYGSMWSFANGMESSVSIALFSTLLFLWICRPLETDKEAGRFGLALAGLMLARLDLVFVAAVLWLAAFVRLRTWRSRLAVSLGSAGPVALYLAVSKLAFGAAMPVSGSLKSTLPYVEAANFERLWDAYNKLLSSGEVSVPLFFRLSQIVVPALAALLAPLFLTSFRRTESGLVVTWAGHPARASFLAATALGVCALASYNFFFVPIFRQGHWYVPVPELFVSLVALHGVDRASSWLTVPRPVALRWTGVVVAAAVAVAFFLRLHLQPAYHARYASFWFDEAPQIRAHLPPATRLIEYDDGIVSWATQLDAMSGTHLGLDLEAATAAKAGTLPRLAVARGYDHVASLVYWGFGGVDTDEGLSSWLASHFPGFGFKARVAYRSKSMNWSIIQLLPPDALNDPAADSRR